MNAYNIQVIENVKSKRIIEIDYLKTLAMFLVVFGHFLECFYSSYSNLLYQLIYLFHIPLFVFISGYLSRFKYRDLFKFCLLYLIFYFLYAGFNHILYGSDLTLTFFHPYWILWYLMSLIFWKMSLPLLDKISNKYHLLTIIITFVFGLYVGSCGIVNRFFSMSRTLAFFPFFVLGYYKRKQNSLSFNTKITNITKLLGVLLVLISFTCLIMLGLFLTASFYMADPYSGLRHSVYQRLIIYVFAFFMIYFICSISISRENILIKNISNNTLTIFLFHGFIINIFKRYSFLSNRNLSILISFVLSIIVLLVFTFIGILYSKIKEKLVKKHSSAHIFNEDIEPKSF